MTARAEVVAPTKVAPWKELKPVKVLELARRVDDAAVMVIGLEPVKVTPLMVLPGESEAADPETLPVTLPMMPATALSWPLIVEEPVTASEVEVAPWRVVPPVTARVLGKV